MSRVAGGRPPLAFLHGFTQTPESWQSIGTLFADDFDVRYLDVPYHSTDAPRVDSFLGACDAIVEGLHDVVLVGYSMGARLALGATLRHPDRVRALAILGCNPGIGELAEREERRRSDEQLAERIEQIGTEAFLHEWLSRDMFARLPASARSGRDRHRASDLASALRILGTGHQPDMWPELGSLDLPLLVMAGELDLPFAAHARRIATLAVERTECVLIADAGHAAHLEQPELFVGHLRAWLERLPDV